MAILIDAGTEYLSRTSAVALGGFTMCAWVYIVGDVGPTTAQPLFSASTNFGTDLEAVVNWNSEDPGGTANIISFLDAGGFDIIDLASRPSTGVWAHWLLTGNGSNVRAGFRQHGNGSYVTAQVAQAGTGTAALRIGDDAFSGNPNARFAAYKLWNAVLTDAEILAEGLQYEPVRWTNLTQWTPMLATSASNAALDRSANGANMTVNGSPTIAEGPPIPWGLRRRKRASYVVAAAPAARQQTLSLLGVGA